MRGDEVWRNLLRVTLSAWERGAAKRLKGKRQMVSEIEQMEATEKATGPLVCNLVRVGLALAELRRAWAYCRVRGWTNLQDRVFHAAEMMVSSTNVFRIPLTLRPEKWEAVVNMVGE